MLAIIVRKRFMNTDNKAVGRTMAATVLAVPLLSLSINCHMNYIIYVCRRASGNGPAAPILAGPVFSR